MATPTSDIGALARNIQPLRAQVYGPERAMTERAHRLEDSAVEDVGADRDRRVEPEREDEQRRHQRAAAHAGEAGERPDQEPASESYQVIYGDACGADHQDAGLCPFVRPKRTGEKCL